MKLLITGHTGILGSELIKVATLRDIEHTGISSKTCNITDINLLQKLISDYNPNIIIHCAAMTKPMKSHDINIGESIRNNIIGTANIASLCADNNIRLIYISTDYVYSIKNKFPVSEDGIIEPINNYARSKLGGEQAVSMLKDSLILRCSFTQRPFLYDLAFIDAYRSYLYADEISPTIINFSITNICGIINVGGNRVSVFDHANKSKKVLPASRLSTNEFVPEDTSMDISRMQKYLNIH